MRGFNLSWIRSQSRRGQVRPAPRPFRPRLESLESRWVPASGGTPTQNFVQQLYQDYLHRTADATGLSFWSSQIDNGSLSRFQVVFAIEASPEGEQVFINDLYRRFLSRAADPTGTAFWTSYLNGNNTGLNDNSDATAQSTTTGLEA